MGVLKEYECRAHGIVFETDVSPARCPHGCRSIVRVFTKAPGFVSGKTRTTDRITAWQARQMGMTDINLAHGRSALENARMAAWASQAPDMRPRTFDVPQGANLSATLAAQGLGASAYAEDGASMTRGKMLAQNTIPIRDPRGEKMPP